MGDLEHDWDNLHTGPAPIDAILKAAKPRERRQIKLFPSAGVAFGLVGAFAAGMIIAQPNGPDGTGIGEPGVPGATPVAFSGELAPAENCDALLGYYQRRALELVGDSGWNFDTGRLGLQDGALDRDLTSETSSLRNFYADTDQRASELRAPAAAPKSAENSVTGTNVQEQGVDEPDQVKTNGELLVRVKDAEVTTYDVSGKAVKYLGAVDLTGIRDAEILLSGETVIAIGATRGSSERLSGSGTWVYQIDISDPATPKVTKAISFDAAHVTARQHDSVVRLVMTAGLPELNFVEPNKDRTSKEAEKTNQNVIKKSKLADWVPTYSVDGAESKPWIDCPNVAIPKTARALNTMAVAGFDVSDPAEIDGFGVVADAQTTYESDDHLYLATDPYWNGCFDFCKGGDADDGGTTQLYNFKLNGTKAEYLGAGEVEGSIRDRWSLDEYDGILRVVVGPTVATGNFNSIITLRERAGDLVELGRVDKIGVNEDLKSVRWFDGLAIAVTFRQIDPLFTVDLTDPSKPKLSGELKIPGFSGYLHPLGEHSIIGMGEGPDEANETYGAQAGLFNVTKLANPKRIDVINYGDNTEALAPQDPRQFTWLPTQRVFLTVIAKYRGSNTGLISIVKVSDGVLTNKMLEAEYGNDIDDLRTVPLPDGRVVLVTGEDARFLAIP